MNEVVKMSWSEYQLFIQKIADKLIEFLNTNNIKIDLILPILRGGGIPAISLSHLLNVKRLEAIQVFHDYTSKKVWTGCNSVEHIEDKNRPYVVLLVDDYHATGKSVYLMYDSIREHLPNAKFLYVAVGRDIGYLEDERDFIYSCYGFLGNECGIVTADEALEKGVATVNTVYPWEILEEEIANIQLIEGE